MKTFCTEYWVSNEVGRVCRMGGMIEAETLEEAEAKAEVLGHVVVGEFTGEEDAGLKVDANIESTQQERDGEWLASNNPNEVA